MARVRKTADAGQRGRSRGTATRYPYPMATQWALKLLLGSKACRLMAAHPCGPDEAILILLAAEDLSEQKVTEQMLLQRLQAAQRELDRLPPQHPLELDCNLAGLAGLLGLNPVETEVLALMVYRELATGMEDVLRLNDSAGGQNGFAALAARMLDRPLNDVREALSSRGKLLQCGLLAYPDSRREGPFALPIGLADMLMHHTDAPSIILRRYSQHDHPAAHELNDFQHLGSLLETLTRFLQGAMTTSLEGVNILIHGRPGTGKTELARALAVSLGASLHEIRNADSYGLPIAPQERFSSYRYCQSLLAADEQALLLFDECEDVFAHGEGTGHKAWINNMLERNARPALWLCNEPGWMDPAYIRRFDLIIDMPELTPQQRLHMAEQRFANLPVSADWLQRLAEQPEVQAAHLASASRVARTMGTSDTAGSEAAAEQVLDGLGKALGVTLKPQPAQESGSELAFDPALSNTDQDLRQLLNGIRSSRTGRLCLFGPPGTGKSEFARYLASELHLPLLVRRASDLLAPYLGMSERNIAAAFAEAAKRGGVLLIDEADSLLFSRERSRYSWEVSQVNELLQQMERFQGILIMTSNHTQLIDHAAFRRFDLKIRFDYLTPEQSCHFFRKLIGKPALRLEGNFLQHSLRDMQLTPGDFSAVVRRFKVLAQPVNEVGLLQGLRQEHAIRTAHGDQA